MPNDFVVSAHALERFQERFPTDWTDDEGIAHLICEEVNDAIAEGRSSNVAPIELSTVDPDRWEVKRGTYAWVPNKTRGYVFVQEGDELLVTTVLSGRSTDEARRSLYGEGRPRLRRKKGERDSTSPHGDDAPPPGLA